MCGITAIVNLQDGQVEHDLIQKISKRIAHRGPDNDGYFHGDNFSLGHRRLSIMDHRAGAHQPMRYLSHVITYNGEVYNYRQLREELVSAGYQFATSGDTEVVIAAYDHWGPNCVSRFEGMWAFVIFDSRNQILFGSRDRFGQKPFHYGQFGNYFMVASESKQFCDLPGFKATINQAVAFNFLNYGALNYSGDTFFEGIMTLPAGHNLMYDIHSKKLTLKRWYSFPQKHIAEIGLDEAAHGFRKLLTESIARRVQCDTKFGSCLSGGLDSSSIVCIAKQLMSRHADFPTLSICWQDASIDEQEYIDAVTEHTQCANRKIFPDISELNDDVVLDKIIYHQDQPILSTSHFSEFKVYQAAGLNGLPVLLDGQGADEYLGGYGIFNWYHLHGLFATNQYISLMQEWNEMRKRSRFSDNYMLRTFLYIKFKQQKPFISDFLNKQWGKNFLADNPTLPAKNGMLSAKKLSFHQIFTSSLPFQLHSADRNSMCHSVEARLPFLDHNLVEYCYTLPDKYKISRGLSKLVLRTALKGILPDKISQRQTKLGFPAPETSWMMNNLSWLRNEVTSGIELLNDFVDSKNMKQIFLSFNQSDAVDHTALFRLITLARWVRIFNVAIH